jgi:hypothetical protein
LIIPLVNHDESLFQASVHGGRSHKTIETACCYPRLPKVADDVIEANVAVGLSAVTTGESGSITSVALPPFIIACSSGSPRILRSSPHIQLLLQQDQLLPHLFEHRLCSSVANKIGHLIKVGSEVV